MVDLTPAALIKSGSGLALVALGLYLAIRPNRGRIGIPFGVYLSTLGFCLAVFNLAGADPILAVPANWAFNLGTIVLMGAFAIFVWRFSAPITRADARFFIIAALALLVTCGFFLTAWMQTYTVDFLQQATGSSQARATSVYWRNVLFAVHYCFAACALLFLSLRQRLASIDPDLRRRTAWVVSGLSPYYIFEGLEKVNLPGAPLFMGQSGLLPLTILWALFGLVWIPSVKDPMARTSRNVALWITGVFTVCFLIVAIQGAQRVNDGPLSAVARFSGILILAAALFRANVFGPETWMSRFRGMYTASSVAFMFIVAEAMEAILGSEIGIAAGAAVATLILVVGHSLERQRTITETRPDAGETYRAALRLAFADGKVTRAERVQLDQLENRLQLDRELAKAMEREVAAERRNARSPRGH